MGNFEILLCEFMGVRRKRMRKKRLLGDKVARERIEGNKVTRRSELAGKGWEVKGYWEVKNEGKGWMVTRLLGGKE